MFRRSHRAAGHCAFSAPRMSSVRLLETPEDLRAAVERAKEFERRSADRGGPVFRYEQYVRAHNLADVVQLGAQAVGA
jgi:hypothetical protein